MNYIILNNKKSTEINGLMICTLPPISKPAKRIDQKEIDGRDGDIITELGYKAYDKEFQVGLTYNYDVNEVISYFDSEGIVVFSNEPDKYYRYKIIEQIDFERLIRFKTATIKMHIQPFKYSINEEYILSKDRKDKTLQGETIDITDSAEMRFSEFNVRGNSRQETRSGKNYLNMFTKYKAGDTTTINGVKFTFNKDGSITCYGTASTDATLDFSIPDGGQKISGTNKKMVALIDGDYTNSGKAIAFIVYDKDWANNKNIPISTINKNISQVMVDNIEYSRFRVIVYKDTVINNRTLYLQVLDTSQEDLSYEQYGLMPSSDYPSEVESCGDNVNLFDKENANIVNGYFDDTNKQIVSNATCRTLGIKVEPNTTYTVSKIASTRLSLRLSADELKIGATFVTSNKIDDTADNASEATITTLEDTKYLFVWYFFNNKDYTEQEILDSIKIEKGSTSTPYSPFGQGCINEVICNKNILDLTEFNGVTSNGLTSKVADDGKVTITGTLSSAVNTHLRLPYIFTKSMLGKTLTLSTSGTTNFNLENITNIGFKEANTSINNNTYINPTKLKTTFEVTEDVINRVTNLDFYFVSTITNVNISFYLQLEEGSTATDYVKHQSQTYTIPTQQPFRTCGDYADTFIKKNNKWFERHYGNRYIFTGNENWQLRDTSSNTTDNKIVLFSLTSPFEYKLDNNNKYAFSNNFNIIKKIDNIVNMYAKGVGMAFYYNNTNLTHFLYINTNQHLTVDDLKAWLAEQYNAGTPVYVDYVLAEPLDIECTEEQSEILWDIDQNAKTYDKVTHMYSTDEISPVIELIYFTPTNETINNEGNIQSRPILRLEKTVSEAVELTINDIRFKYDFGDDSYTEIDCEEKAVKYEGLNRNRKITIGYEFPKLNIGSNKIVMHDGDCIIKILRKDRWL